MNDYIGGPCTVCGRSLPPPEKVTVTYRLRGEVIRERYLCEPCLTRELKHVREYCGIDSGTTGDSHSVARTEPPAANEVSTGVGSGAVRGRTGEGG